MTPNPLKGGHCLVTLEGDTAVANVPLEKRYHGCRLSFTFGQDENGGHAVTWGTDYAVTWTPNTAAGMSHIEFAVSDGTRLESRLPLAGWRLPRLNHRKEHHGPHQHHRRSAGRYSPPLSPSSSAKVSSPGWRLS